MVLDMMVSVIGYFTNTIFAPLLQGIARTIPDIIAGGLFLFFAYFGIRIAMSFAETGLNHKIKQKAVVRLLLTVIGVFLWFSVFLMFLSIIGLDSIAASLGTAVGFIGLGIAYALKDMIADSVAGVYLLRDEDFNIGDKVESGGVEGTVKDIDIRKTRFELEDGNITVIANKEVEKKWTTKK